MVRLLSLLTLCLWSFSDSFAQNNDLTQKVSINYQQQPLGTILRKLQQKYQLKFSYSKSLLPLQKKVTLRVNNRPLGYTLTKLFTPIDIQFALIGDQIVLKKRKQVVNLTQRKTNVKRNAWQSTNQNKITIQIFDASTSNPIPRVHVIRMDSAFSGNSNQVGIVRFVPPPNQELTLKFTHIGYESTRLTVNPRIKRKYTLWMIPKIEKLAPITISINRDKRWKRLFNKFKNDFLGTSSNASQCKILNPWVVEFVETNQGITLKKTSCDTLKIENYALGYKVLFLLSKFDLSQDDVHYRGRCWFAELIPKNRKQNRRWSKNRKRAYRGSFQHFLASLANNNIEKAGFEVLFSKLHPSKNNGIFFTQPLEKFVKPSEQPNQYVFFSPHYMKIIYTGELEEYNYLKWYKKSNPWLRGPFKPQNQSSWIRLKLGKLTFDRQGNVLDNRQDVIRYGYWAWEREGEMVPHNYANEAPQSARKPRKR